MTVRFGWAAAAAALLLLGALIVFWRISVRRAEQWAKIDVERERQIANLEQDARLARELAAEKQRLADAFRTQRDAARELLAENQDRIRRIRRNESGRAEDPEEERWLHLERIHLLEESLRIADAETLALRETVQAQRIELGDLSAALELQAARIESYQKLERRRRRWRWLAPTLAAVAGAGLGFAAHSAAQ